MSSFHNSLVPVVPTNTPIGSPPPYSNDKDRFAPVVDDSSNALDLHSAVRNAVLGIVRDPRLMGSEFDPSRLPANVLDGILSNVLAFNAELEHVECLHRQEQDRIRTEHGDVRRALVASRLAYEHLHEEVEDNRRYIDCLEDDFDATEMELVDLRDEHDALVRKHDCIQQDRAAAQQETDNVRLVELKDLYLLSLLALFVWTDGDIVWTISEARVCARERWLCDRDSLFRSLSATAMSSHVNATMPPAPTNTPLGSPPPYPADEDRSAQVVDDSGNALDLRSAVRSAVLGIVRDPRLMGSDFDPSRLPTNVLDGILSNVLAFNAELERVERLHRQEQDRIRTEHGDVRRALVASRLAYEHLHEEVEDNRRYIDRLEDDFDATEMELVDLCDEHDALVRKHDRIQQDRAAAQQEVDRLEDMCRDLEHQVIRLQTDNVRLVELKDLVRASNQNLQSSRLFIPAPVVPLWR
ncbi:hypothetical protein FB446DRAFT_794190 [Lentinula raphanica]|nr:hypothetical protein FB446DRAFT_794190 [Lentinula raphanica]